MHFNCGKFGIDKTRWHSWFAWHPVRCSNGYCYWLERVERKFNHARILNDKSPWMYRLPQDWADIAFSLQVRMKTMCDIIFSERVNNLRAVYKTGKLYGKNKLWTNAQTASHRWLLQELHFDPATTYHPSALFEDEIIKAARRYSNAWYADLVQQADERSK